MQEKEIKHEEKLEFSGKDESGIEWSLPAVRLPEKYEDMETDVRNMFKTFMEQFGGTEIDENYDYNQSFIDMDYKDDALAHNIGTCPRLLKNGISKPRNMQVRLAAHEVEHIGSTGQYSQEIGNKYNFLYKCMPQFDDFRMLQKKFGERFDEIQNMKLDYKPLVSDQKNYEDQNEIFARLRSYQIYLIQGKENNPTEFHEFIEILKPEDLRWLDDNYTKARIKKERIIIPSEEKKERKKVVITLNSEGKPQ